MATLLFIDTNIWLDFYRSNNEAGLSLLKRLKPLAKFILVTDQIEMEFKKNRQREIQSSLKALLAPQGMFIPAFLRGDEADELEKRLEEAQRLVKQIKSSVPRLLKEPEAHDPVYQICHAIFNKNDHLCYGQDHKKWAEVHDKAARRYQLGYPPRKSDDTSMGDAVNWEWIVHCAQTTKSNLALVSRDYDYGVPHGDTIVLNDYLRVEFSRRVHKGQSISLYSKLTDALKELKVRVTHREASEDKRLAEDALVRGPLANKMIGLATEYLNAVSNSPLTGWAQGVARTQAALSRNMDVDAVLNSPEVKMAHEAAQKISEVEASIKRTLGERQG